MKITWFPLVVGLFIYLHTSAAETVVTGKITHPTAEQVSINYDKICTGGTSRTATAKVDEEGSFTLTVPIEKVYEQIEEALKGR